MDGFIQAKCVADKRYQKLSSFCALNPRSESSTSCHHIHGMTPQILYVATVVDVTTWR